MLHVGNLKGRNDDPWRKNVGETGMHDTLHFRKVIFPQILKILWPKNALLINAPTPSVKFADDVT